MTLSIYIQRFLLISFLLFTASISAFARTNATQKANCTNDTIPPLIFIAGPDTLCVTLQSVYVDMGATAFDSCDGDVTANVIYSSTVDTRFLGIYIVSYYATDSSGNHSDTLTRVVYVVSAPGIQSSLQMIDTIDIPVGSNFDFMQYNFKDQYGNDINDQVVITHNVNTNALGFYQVKYTVEFIANRCNDLHRDSLIKVVRVFDDVAPIIAAKTSSIVKINLNDSFSYQNHITLTDNHCTQQFLWDHLVVISNNLDTSTTGVYTLTFQTEDSVGNKSDEFDLLVQVKDFAAIGSILDSGVDIYPNPTSNTIDLRFNVKIKTVNVYNAQGQLINSMDVLNAKVLQNVELGDACGIYQIELISNDGLYYREKVVKL